MSNIDKWYEMALNHKSIIRLLGDKPELDINDINVLKDGSIEHTKGFIINGYKTLSYTKWCYEQNHNM